jgi:hypothetical protein
MIKVEEARIKIEGDSSSFRPLPPTKLNDIFVRMEDLNKEIHTKQLVHSPTHANAATATSW